MVSKRHFYLFLCMATVAFISKSIVGNVYALTITQGSPDNSYLVIETNAGGGGNIDDAYYKLTDYTNSSGSNSFSWNHPTYGSGNVYSSANFETGELKVLTEIDTTGGSGTQSNSGYSIATIWDRIEIEADPGTDFSNPVQVTFEALISGSMTAVQGTPNPDTQIRLDIFKNGRLVDPAEFRSTNFGDTIPSSLTNTFDVYSADPIFDLRYMITTSISGGNDHGILDFSHTASLGIKLPDGFTAVTESGFLLSDTGNPQAPVPEPATMFLVGSGLLGLAGLGRKKIFNKEA